MKFISKKASLFGLLGLALLCLPLSAQTTPADWLEKIDQYRLFQAEGFSFQYTVNDPSDTAQPESVMTIYLKKSDRNSVLCLYQSPADLRGRRIFVQANSFWLLDHAMRDPIRISSRQMMFGQASAGDITRLSFNGFYHVDSSAAEGDSTVLTLSALKGVEVSYPSIRLTVHSTDARPIKAELFAATGAALKTITYQEFEPFGDRMLLTAFTITNLLNKEESHIRLDKFASTTLADRYFSQGGMKALK